MTGIAFEGGGIKGSYEIGAYLAIKDCHIKIKGICGTSIGAFNGAAIISGNAKPLLDFWLTVEPGKVMGLEPSFINGIVNSKRGPSYIKGLVKSAKTIIKNRGLDLSLIKNQLDKLIDEDMIRNSKLDFGLVTVKRKGLKPILIFKEDIPQGKIKEYVLASCYLPVFKKEKLIDDSTYLDGGFFDNCPVNMLLDKGYKKIFAIKDNGIGIVKKPKANTAKIINVEPSRHICSIFELNPENICNNVLMGYFDTIRIIKKYDGEKFVIKPKSSRYFKRICRKIDAKAMKRVKAFFHTKTMKETVIKALEYAMELNEENYYQILSYHQVIKKAKKYQQQHFVIEFIKNLK